jgi:hypothetical protein
VLPFGDASDVSVEFVRDATEVLTARRICAGRRSRPPQDVALLGLAASLMSDAPAGGDGSTVSLGTVLSMDASENGDTQCARSPDHSNDVGVKGPKVGEDGLVSTLKTGSGVMELMQGLQIPATSSLSSIRTLLQSGSLWKGHGRRLLLMMTPSSSSV